MEDDLQAELEWQQHGITWTREADFGWASYEEKADGEEKILQISFCFYSPDTENEDDAAEEVRRLLGDGWQRIADDQYGCRQWAGGNGTAILFDYDGNLAVTIRIEGLTVDQVPAHLPKYVSPLGIEEYIRRADFYVRSHTREHADALLALIGKNRT